MHVLCRNLDAAISLLNAATTSGYRESGISISALSTQQEKVLVAIRTTSIRLDVPIAAYDDEIQCIRPFGLTSEYITNLFNRISEVFSDNEVRKEKLLRSLSQMFRSRRCQISRETKGERHTRKRIEGLKLQAARVQVKDSNVDPDCTVDTAQLDKIFNS